MIALRLDSQLVESQRLEAIAVRICLHVQQKKTGSLIKNAGDIYGCEMDGEPEQAGERKASPV